jgi:phosphoglucosamine mutase
MTIGFGTDGVRGRVNTDLTPEVALALGRAAARVLAGRDWVVGRDTRESGTMLESAFSAGICSEGSDIARLGILPTPGVAYAALSEGAAGAAITASHNAYGDNGFKIIGDDGLKLSDEVEARIEAEMLVLLTDCATGQFHSRGNNVGRVTSGTALSGAYSHWLEQLAGDAIGGRRPFAIGVDCGNGAASVVGPKVLCEVANCRVINAQPDGRNINAGCGSTDPSRLQAMVVAEHLDAGFAFDGDADRVLAVDESGAIVDGDQMLAMLAIHRKANMQLAGGRVVVTEWSNLGLLQSMQRNDIAVSVTPVGDRFVLREMARTGAALGGEQSGHIIFRDLATTGDGILTAVQMLALMATSSVPLSVLSDRAMSRSPQAVRRVHVKRSPRELVAELRDLFDRENECLRERGRVVVRASGTEAVVWVMAESETSQEATQLVDRLASLVKDSDGLVADGSL